MEAQILAAAFTAFGVIFAALVPVVADKIGWRESVLRDIALFEKLYPYADGVDDDTTLACLRISIFDRVNRAVTRTQRSYASDILSFVLSFVSSLIVLSSLDISLTLQTLLLCAVSCFTGVIAVELIVRLLRRWPKSEKNAFYMNARKKRERNREAEKLIAKSKELIQEVNLEKGWYGNYYAFTAWWRREMGYDPMEFANIGRDKLRQKGGPDRGKMDDAEEPERTQ